MKDWKKWMFPPVWLILLLTVISTVALAGVFVEGKSEHPVAYAIYVFSFYTLTLICLAVWKRLPGRYRHMKEKVYGNPYTGRYLTDAVYKTHISLYLSLGINLLYVVTNGISSFFYHSLWFGIFAVYYGIMAVMRFLLVRYVGKNSIGEAVDACDVAEWKRSRSCVCILLSVNVILSGVVIMMAYYNRGFMYRGYLIYVMAVYTFYSTAAAVRDIIKYRRYKSPVMSVSKIIKLASSLFSMLFLETAMFAQFGQETPMQVKRIMIMATGGGICVVVVSLSVYMIVRATKEIRRYTSDE